MSDINILQGVLESPQSQLLLVFGLLLIFLGITGKFKDWFEVSDKWRVISFAMGVVMLVVGVMIRTDYGTSDDLQRLTTLTEKSRLWGDEWKELNEEGIFAQCLFPLAELFGDQDVSETGAKQNLIKQSGQWSRERAIQPLSISPDLEYSTSEEGYMVRIPYTYVFVSKDGRQERGAKRLILTWKQVHAGWKITKIEEKSFPLWP